MTKVGRVIDLGQGWRTERLDLEPLVAGHAAELAPLLDDVALHQFTGGTPLSEAALALRYAHLAQRRSPDGSQLWGNWVMRVRATAPRSTLPGPRDWHRPAKSTTAKSAGPAAGRDAGRTGRLGRWRFLRHSNWTRPPWSSAGPRPAIFRRSSASLPLTSSAPRGTG